MTKIDFVNESNGRTSFSVNIPERWDEFPAQIVRFIFEKYEQVMSGELTPEMLQVLTIYKLIGIRRERPSHLASRDAAIIENVDAIRARLQFMFDYPEKSDFPRLTFNSIQNPLPTIRVKNRTWFGPATLCQDLTFGEFRNGALALNMFFKTEDIGNLDECIAHIYRPGSMTVNKAGRKVKPVNPGSFEDEIKAVHQIPSWQKNLIMLWFSSCIGFLQSGNIVLGGEDVDMKLLFSSGDDNSGGPAATWNDLLMQISKEGTLGNMEEVDAAPLMVVLLNMWSNYKENKRNERKIKKAKKA